SPRRGAPVLAGWGHSYGRVNLLRLAGEEWGDRDRCRHGCRGWCRCRRRWCRATAGVVRNRRSADGGSRALAVDLVRGGSTTGRCRGVTDDGRAVDGDAATFGEE